MFQTTLPSPFSLTFLTLKRTVAVVAVVERPEDDSTVLAFKKGRALGMVRGRFLTHPHLGPGPTSPAPLPIS